MGAGRDCRLLYVTDSIAGRCLLVDSGAQRSILPAQSVDTMAGRHGPRMDAANGTPIRTYGTRYVEVCFSGASAETSLWPLCLHRSLARTSSVPSDC